MKASDVMVRRVITVSPQTSVFEVAKLLVDNDISALPVVDVEGEVVGIISEADLVQRAELGTEKKHPWWIEAVMPAASLAEEFAKSHGRKVEELMSRHIISAAEDTPLDEIATLLERHRIKRVPILRDGKLVGIVSRANLVQALASLRFAPAPQAEADRAIRLDLLARLADQHWTNFGERNVIVANGVVHIWGLADSPEERNGLVVLAESVPGVAGVRDEMIAAY